MSAAVWELLLALGVLVEPGDTDCPTCGASEGRVCPSHVPPRPDEPLYHPARMRLATWYSARNIIALSVTLALFVGAVLWRGGLGS